jgi:hypothetical protein
MISSPQVTYDGGEIVLFSPPDNSQESQYTLNGVAYSMKPGSVQRFANDRNWTIEVNRGNGQSMKYTLSTGRYKFKPSSGGIALFTTQDQPNLSPAFAAPGTSAGTVVQPYSAPSSIPAPTTTILPPVPMP